MPEIDPSQIISILGDAVNWQSTSNQLISKPLEQSEAEQYILVLNRAGIQATYVNFHLCVDRNQIPPNTALSVDVTKTCHLSASQIKSQSLAVVSQVNEKKSEGTVLDKAAKHPAYDPDFSDEILQNLPRGSFYLSPDPKSKNALRLTIHEGGGRPSSVLIITSDQNVWKFEGEDRQFDSLDSLLEAVSKRKAEGLGLPAANACYRKHANIFADSSCKTPDQARQKLWEYQMAFPREQHGVLVKKPWN